MSNRSAAKKKAAASNRSAAKKKAAASSGGEGKLEARVSELESAHARVERAARHLAEAAADLQAVQGHTLRALEAPSQEERGRGQSLIRAAYYRVGTGVARARAELAGETAEDHQGPA